MIECGYEENFDLLGVLFKDPYTLKKSIEIGKDYIVDIDKKDEMASLQVVNFSEKVKLSKKTISESKIDVDLDVGEFLGVIYIRVTTKDGETEELQIKVYL